MKQQLIYLFLATLFYFQAFVIGNILFAVLGIWKRIPIQLIMVLSTVFGLFALSIQIVLYSLISLEWNQWIVLLPWLLTFLVFFKRYKDQLKLEYRLVLNIKKKIARLHPIVKMLLIFIVLLLLLFYYQLITQPFVAWDAYAVWFYKAKAYYLNNGIFFQDPTKIPEGLRHQSYPPFLPLITLQFYIFFNEINEIIAKSTNFIFLLTFIGVYLHVMQEKLKQAIPWLGIITIITTTLATQFLFHPNYMGYADYILGMLLGTCILFLYMSLKEKSVEYYLLGLVFAVVAALTKNEGQFFILSYSFVGVMLYLLTKSKNLMTIPKKYLLASIGMLIPLIAWGVTMKYFNISSEFSSMATISKAFYEIKPRLNTSVNTILIYIKHNVSIFVFFITIFLAFVYAIFSKQKRIMLLFFIFTIQLTGYIFIYLITPYDMVWHIKLSFDRIVMQLLPMGYALTVLTITDTKKAK